MKRTFTTLEKLEVGSVFHLKDMTEEEEAMVLLFLEPDMCSNLRRVEFLDFRSQSVRKGIWNYARAVVLLSPKDE